MDNDYGEKHWIDIVKHALSKHGFDSESVQMIRLGGLSNMNYKVIVGSGEDLRCYLLKVLNQGNAFFVDRDLERQVIKAGSQVGLSPKVIEDQKGYRIQEFIPGDEIILEDLQIEESSSKKDLVGSIVNFQSKLTSILDHLLKEEPMLVRFLKKIPIIHSKIVKELQESTLTNKFFLLDSIAELAKDQPMLLSYLSNFNGPVKICHNDLNLTNCLKLRHTESPHKPNPLQILLLDMEYAGPNFIHFDLANLLHELDCTYPSTAPYFTMHSHTYSKALKASIASLYYTQTQECAYVDMPQFIEDVMQWQMFALYYWMWLCVNDACGGWPGTSAYVEIKMERYRAMREKLFGNDG